MPSHQNLLKLLGFLFIFIICSCVIPIYWPALIWIIIVDQFINNDHEAGITFGRTQPYHETCPADYGLELNRDATAEHRTASPMDEIIVFAPRVEEVEPFGIQDTRPHDMIIFNHLTNVQHTFVVHLIDNSTVNEDATLYDHTPVLMMENGHNRATVNEPSTPVAPIDDHTADIDFSAASEPEEEEESGLNTSPNVEEHCIIDEAFNGAHPDQGSTITETNTIIMTNTTRPDQINLTVEQPASTPPAARENVLEVQRNTGHDDDVPPQAMATVYITNQHIPKAPRPAESSDSSEVETAT